MSKETIKVKSDLVTLAASKAFAYWTVEDAKINILNKNGVNLTNQLRDVLYREDVIEELKKIVDEGGDYCHVFEYLAGGSLELQTLFAFTDSSRLMSFTVENYKRTGYWVYDFLPSNPLIHRKLSNKANSWKSLAQVFESEYVELTEYDYNRLKPWLDSLEIDMALEGKYDEYPDTGFFSFKQQRKLKHLKLL